MRNRFIISLLAVILLLISSAASLEIPLASAGTNETLTIADFEDGIDPRGILGYPAGGNIPYTPIAYALENPTSLRGDDINWWDVYSDSDGIDEAVDYTLQLATINQPSPQNWSSFTTLQKRFMLIVR